MAVSNASPALHALAQEHSREAIMLCEVSETTPALILRQINPAFTRVIGYAPEEVIGRPSAMFRGPCSDPDTVRQIEQAILRRTPTRVEHLVYSKSGRPLWIDLELRPLDCSSAKMMVAVWRDISERRRVESERSLLERLLAAVMAAVDQGILVIGEGGRIVMSNLVFLQWSGWRADQILGLPLEEILAPDDRTDIREAVARALEFAGHQRRVVRVLAPDDQEVLCEFASRSLPRINGKPFGIIVVSRVESPNRPQRIGDLVAQLQQEKPPRSVVAGRLQLVGLSDVRTALGARWGKVAGQAMATAEATIRKRLGPRDVLEVADSDAFVICFADLSEEEAAFKARIIGQEVRERLLGNAEAVAEESQVDAFAATVELPDAELAPDISITDLILEKLGSRRDESRRQAQQLLQAALKEGRLEPAPVYTISGQSAPFRIAKFPEDIQVRLDRAFASLSNEAEITFQADILMLGITTDWVIRHHKQGGKSVVLVPVRFTNLMVRRFLDQYLEVCRRIPPEIRNLILFELVDVPQGVAVMRMAGVAQALAPHSRGLALEISGVDINPEVFGYKMPAATMRYQKLVEVLGKGERFRKLVRALKMRRIRLIAKEAPSPEDALRLATEGIDLVSF